MCRIEEPAAFLPWGTGWGHLRDERFGRRGSSETVEKMEGFIWGM